MPSRSAVQSGPEVWVERLLLAMINEAAKCLEERVVPSAQHVDLAMILGTGFPPFRGGLLRYADVLGMAKVTDRLDALAQSEGPRLAPCALLREMRESKGKFRDDLAW
jgi:3-hydroxyacyl-CoA dehydrogenase/enoyl-CoA hydratase/3-hydroxybutyryl-CoA epimerase